MEESEWRDLFQMPKPIIAMVHVFDGEKQQQIDQALEDAELLQRGGVDGLLVENYDCGYLDTNRATGEIGEQLAVITRAVVKHSKIPVGVNVLPNDYWQSFSVALETGGRFIQMDHVVGSFLGHESVNLADYIPTRERHSSVVVLGGIHPKYYTLTNPATPIEKSAKKAKALADAVVVTGNTTGGETCLYDLEVVRRALRSYPLIVGSGLVPANVRTQLAIADGAIVGTTFKKNGVLPKSPIVLEKVQRLMDEVSKFR